MRSRETRTIETRLMWLHGFMMVDNTRWHDYYNFWSFRTDTQPFTLPLLIAHIQFCYGQAHLIRFHYRVIGMREGVTACRSCECNLCSSYLSLQISKCHQASLVWNKFRDLWNFVVRVRGVKLNYFVHWKQPSSVQPVMVSVWFLWFTKNNKLIKNGMCSSQLLWKSFDCKSCDCQESWQEFLSFRIV